MTKHIFITFLTSSEYNNLHRILAQFIHNTINKIESLLIGQSGDDTNHHDFLVLRKSQLFLQCKFIFYFIQTEVANTVPRTDLLICLRIPLLIIKSVHNSLKFTGPGSHQAIQMFPVERSLNLLRISIADRCNPVCINNAAFQIICVTKRLQFVRRKI